MSVVPVAGARLMSPAMRPTPRPMTYGEPIVPSGAVYRGAALVSIAIGTKSDGQESKYSWTEQLHPSRSVLVRPARIGLVATTATLSPQPAGPAVQPGSMAFRMSTGVPADGDQQLREA